MKAQTFLPDYLASLLVFAGVIGIFLSSWNGIVSNQNFFTEEEELSLQASRTAAFLSSTPGYPEDWEKNSVEVKIPGFASSDLFLQQEKIESFDQLDYATQRSLLKAQNFNLTFWNQTGIVEAGGEKLTFGDSFENADTVVPLTRTVRINTSNEIKNAQMKYIVWR